MKPLTTLSDPTYTGDKKFNALERFSFRFINDKRDLPFIKLIAAIHILVVPAVIVLYTQLLDGWMWWALAIPYFYISQLYYKGRYGLMYHCMCHRKTFKKKYQPAFHNYITWVLSPLFGHTPESYFSHHMGMHHIENNLPEDDSSTMLYQRDSIKSFAAYFIHFILLGFKNTFLYLYNRKRKKLYTRMGWGEISYFVVCIALCFVNLKATLVVFIVPLFFARLVMMLGNWTQHAFVDRTEPDNIYKSAINCINTPYNRICWNDGYHIVHHLRPGLHYTEMPGEFLNLKDEFAKQKALVFDGIHYLHVFTYLMTGRYDKLADNLVNINNTFKSREEAIALMRQRTQRIAVS